MSLPSIYIASLNKDNNIFTSSFFNINDPLEKHVSDNSDNTGEGPSSHPCKGKSTLKMKVKGKGCITSALAMKKWTAAAAKLKPKITLKLKSNKVKSVKQSLFLKKCEKCLQLSFIVVLLFSGSSSLLPLTPTLKTFKADLKLNFKCSPIILSLDKTPSSSLTSLFSKSSPLKVSSKPLNKCKCGSTPPLHHELKCVVKCSKCFNEVKAYNGVKACY